MSLNQEIKASIHISNRFGTQKKTAEEKKFLVKFNIKARSEKKPLYQKYIKKYKCFTFQSIWLYAYLNWISLHSYFQKSFKYSISIENQDENVCVQ